MLLNINIWKLYISEHSFYYYVIQIVYAYKNEVNNEDLFRHIS